MTDKTRYFIFFIFLTISAIFVDYVSPKKIDWRLSYSREDKIPFGCYVLYDLLPTIFPEKKITTINLNFYEYGIDSNYSSMNYIVINESYNPGKEEINSLLSFAEEGSCVFLSASNFGDELADSLGIKTGIEYSLMDSIEISFTNTLFKDKYFFPTKNQISIITKYDSSKTQVLAYSNNKNPILIKIKISDGFILLNSTPFAFTNYHILESKNSKFILSAFSFMPVHDVLWDEYHKIGGPQSATVIRYILHSDPLKWAYILTLCSVLLFFLFESKRRQRIIPEIKKVKNTTLDFVDTVSLLYLSHQNHRVISEKRISYFFDSLRSNWFIKQDQFYHIEYVAMKTGYPSEKLKSLFDHIQSLEKKTVISESDLISLNNQLEMFYKTVN